MSVARPRAGIRESGPFTIQKYGQLGSLKCEEIMSKWRGLQFSLKWWSPATAWKDYKAV